MQEAGIIRNEKNNQIPEGTFDGINSPQYLNFSAGFIPEAKDSYFEKKTDDDYSTRDPNFKKLQYLPCDPEEDFIQNSCTINESSEKELNDNNSNTVKDDENNNSKNASSKLPDDFGDDLIQAVKTLQVDNGPSKMINAKGIVTSTPFRVKGVEPMPWTSHVNKPGKTEMRHCTITRPFSFEERNKQLMQRKARRIQAILQAEKEARRFRANPVPKFLQKPATNEKNKIPQNATLSSIKKAKALETTQQQPYRFKAKSPKVLRKPAFQPILPWRSLPQPQPFNLNSEIRAKEREAFDNRIKEKERLDERLRQLREAAAKRREEEEIILMRKQLVPKAHPIRKYPCSTKPVSKRALTEPITPIVIKRQRRHESHY